MAHLRSSCCAFRILGAALKSLGQSFSRNWRNKEEIADRIWREGSRPLIIPGICGPEKVLMENGDVVMDWTRVLGCDNLDFEESVTSKAVTGMPDYEQGKGVVLR